MNKKETTKTRKLRDYSKPIVLNLRGEKGLNTYIKIWDLVVFLIRHY